MEGAKTQKFERVSVSKTPVNKPVLSKPKLIEPEIKKPEFDKDSVKVGVVVVHKAFGEGKVVDIDDEIIKVKFESYPAAKMFEFPGAFVNGFLTIK